MLGQHAPDWRRGCRPRGLNHSAIVNPKLREIHSLLGRQRVSGRDDLEVFGRRDDNPDFRAVLRPDCRPPATGLALVSVDNVSLIIDPHGVSSYASSSPRNRDVGCRSKFARTAVGLPQIPPRSSNAGAPVRWPGLASTCDSRQIRPTPATLSGPWRGDSVIGLSGRCALLPWWLCWLNCRSLLSACKRLLQGFKFTGQRRDVVGQPLNLGPIG